MRILIIDHNKDRRTAIEEALTPLVNMSAVVEAFPEIVAEKDAPKARALLEKYDRSFGRFLGKGLHLLHSVRDTALVAVHSTESQACGEAFADWAADQGIPVLKYHGSVSPEDGASEALSFRYPYGVTSNDQPNWKAFFEKWAPGFHPDRVAALWPLLEDKEELVATKALAPFATLDILIQGYLAIRDRDGEAGQAPGALNSPPTYGLLATPAILETAEEATRPARLAASTTKPQSSETYWFDACASDLQGAFTAKSDEIIRKIEIQSDLGAPSLGEILNSERSAQANGALRRVVEILRTGHDSALACPEWAHGFLSEGKTEDDIINLFRAAHEEYMVAHQKVEAYLQ